MSCGIGVLKVKNKILKNIESWNVSIRAGVELIFVFLAEKTVALLLLPEHTRAG